MLSPNKEVESPKRPIQIDEHKQSIEERTVMMLFKHLLFGIQLLLSGMLFQFAVILPSYLCFFLNSNDLLYFQISRR